MFKGNVDDVYPVLSGKALVKVNLRKKETRPYFYSEFLRNIKYSFVRINANGLFLNPENEHVSLVKLTGSSTKSQGYRCRSYEYNMLEDRVGSWVKLKLVAGSVAAAGILMLSAFGLFGKGLFPANRSQEAAIGINLSDGEQKISSDKNLNKPFVVSMSDRENIIMASLSNPMENHFLQKKPEHTNGFNPTHTNSSGTHTNIPSNTTHSNTDPVINYDAGHTDLTGQHINTAHTNYSGHDNVPHTDTGIVLK